MEDDNNGCEKRKEHPEDSEPEKESEALAPPKKRTKFNIHSRQLFCTYSNCPIEKEDALLQLSSKLGDPAEYLIAEEEHKVKDPFPMPKQGFLSANDYIQWAETRRHMYLANPDKYMQFF